MTCPTDEELEAVERFDLEQPTEHMGSASMDPAPGYGDWVRYSDYAALSAERDALKAELAEAVGVLQMIVGGAVYTAADGFSKPHEPEQSRIARAFLARHQKEADT